MLVFGIISAVIAGGFILWFLGSFVGGMMAADFKFVRTTLLVLSVLLVWLLTAIFLCLCA